MSSFVLWKFLTKNDFNAMHAKGSPHGRGGGPRHIALGVRTNAFPIDRFLAPHHGRDITIKTAPQTPKYSASTLTFRGNPGRRGGEWIISDQFANRHPAWTPAAGFPESYDDADPICILLFRVGRKFHVRFSLRSALSRLPSATLPYNMLSESKGIEASPLALLQHFSVPSENVLDALGEEAQQYVVPAFDPKNIIDGRQRIVAAILRRLGQQRFRRSLLLAYGAQCALTRCTTVCVLEAAHITPYRGVKTNAVSNGLLLRADIHTLFDLALISINPAKMRICVSRELEGSHYMELSDTEPALPEKSAAQPSPAALEEHYRAFRP